ncbi:MAG TPA: hypothetical protein PKN48_01170 [Bacteroidales bacterium]|nr:hypothetical protein [Bacteroidales bacterium]
MYKFLVRQFGNLVSPWATGKYETVYTPYVWTAAKRGMLFFCSDYEEVDLLARHYRTFVVVDDIDIEIWKIEIKEPILIKHHLPSDLGDWDKFWNKGIYLKLDGIERDGIFCAKEIKLTEFKKRV